MFQAIMLLALAPYVVLLTVVMGNWVQPFPEAEGLWRPLFEAAMFLWALFDMGTQTAFVKYFAEFRSSDARESVRCVQFFFWWQVFSRLLQLTLVCSMAAYVPRTQYALFAHFLAVYGLVQVPGLVVGVKFVIQALQRFDLQLALDLVEQRLAMYLVPIPFVFLFRAWGRANPEYGEAFGAALGLAMGPQAAALLVAVVGLYFMKVRLRLPLTPLVLAQFDRSTAKRILLFGFKATLGQEPYRIANLVENVIIVGRLASYQTWLGLRSVLNNLTQYVVLFGWSFFVSAVPALSEAYSAGKKRLCQYYVVRYLQFAHLFVAVLAGLLGAIGAPLIRDVMAPQWARAGDYMLLAVAVIVFLPFAWISDMLQQGSGRTGLNAIIMLIEQVIRIGLFWWLIPTLQFPGMYIAILGTIALKCVIGWTCNHLLIVKFRFYFWQMVAAPALAGLVLYGLWRGVALVGAFHGFWPVLALFFVATPISLLGGFFLMGLAGGFDEAAIEELEQAASMSVTLRFAARWFVRVATAGHRLSPLRNRFPVTIAEEAKAEAAELEEAAAKAAKAEA
jgi:O-antigen/teichoic acid export membrane protein